MNEYRIWDPFCGSGTIVMSALSRLIGLNKEVSLDQYENLLQMPTLIQNAEVMNVLYKSTERKEEERERLV